VDEKQTLSHARALRILAFGVSCLKVPKPGISRKKAPKSLEKELESFRLPLTIAKDDPKVGELAANRLEVLDHMLRYLKTGEAKYYREAERVWAIGDRIARAVNTND